MIEVVRWMGYVDVLCICAGIHLEVIECSRQDQPAAGSASVYELVYRISQGEKSRCDLWIFTHQQVELQKQRPLPERPQ